MQDRIREGGWPVPYFVPIFMLALMRDARGTERGGNKTKKKTEGLLARNALGDLQTPNRECDAP